MMGRVFILYNRELAVQYAEEWWNRYNTNFPVFAVDCTNYVSQCLFAGGAKMHGAPMRERGWWYTGDNWSFSWSVAHSLYWYLKGSPSGLRAEEMQDAKELYPGDIICYDFKGNNHWNHTTIVVHKNSDGSPLVNAHTDNSWHRFWTYTDSLAWTNETRYAFLKIIIE